MSNSNNLAKSLKRFHEIPKDISGAIPGNDQRRKDLSEGALEPELPQDNSLGRHILVVLLELIDISNKTKHHL